MPVNLHQPDELFEFLIRLGGRFTRPARIYLFGGSALLILGSPRNTADVDFSLVADEIDELRTAISKLAIELDVDWEESNPTEFMPLPAGYETRHQLIGRFGGIEAYLFDPYSIAVMKIDRAFDSDMDDVRFLLANRHIELQSLGQYIEDVAGRYDEPRRLRLNFDEFRRSLAH